MDPAQKHGGKYKYHTQKIQLQLSKNIAKDKRVQIIIIEDIGP
jgi:hypothetical protein